MFTKFCVAALFSFAAVKLIPGAESAAVPKIFTAYIGGFMGMSYRIELHENALTYTTFEPGERNPKQTTVTPSAEQWRQFRQALDDLKIWKWRAEYRNSPVADGTQWSLEIAYADRSLKTRGSNSYPDDAGRPTGDAEPTKAFRRYLAAIQKLVEGRKFE